jgi:O-antigen/teichoic acid export membrane protein
MISGPQSSNRPTGATWSQSYSALADQALVSLGMFVSSVILARRLSVEEYGAYGAMLAALLLLNSVHASLVTYRLTVDGAVAPAATLRLYAGAAVLWTCLLTLPFAAALFVVARPFAGWPLPAWAAAAMVAWQIQETARRALMADLRHRQALPGDAIAYLGQAGLLWVVSSRQGFSASTAFACMAAVFTAAAALQSAQARIRWAPGPEVKEYGRSGWRIGSWALVANVVNMFSLQALLLLLALLHTAREAACLRALGNLMGATHPVLFSLSNLIVPAAARANHGGGMGSAWRWTWKLGLAGCILLAPYFAVLLSFPAETLAIVYGKGSPYVGLGGPLRVLVLGYFFAALAHLLVAFLHGLRQPKAASAAQFAGLATGLGIG